MITTAKFLVTVTSRTTSHVNVRQKTSAFVVWMTFAVSAAVSTTNSGVMSTCNRLHTDLCAYIMVNKQGAPTAVTCCNT